MINSVWPGLLSNFNVPECLRIISWEREEPEARSLVGGFGRKERMEHLFLNLRGNPRAVVTNADFNLFPIRPVDL